MHEMSLIRNVVDLAVKTCGEAGGLRVKKVRLAVGALRDVVDELVPGLFERLVHGTVAEGAQIELLKVPATGRCRSCGSVMEIDPFDAKTLTCSHCGAERNVALVTGAEFMVLDVEIEMGKAASSVPAA